MAADVVDTALLAAAGHRKPALLLIGLAPRPAPKVNRGLPASAPSAAGVGEAVAEPLAPTGVPASPPPKVSLGLGLSSPPGVVLAEGNTSFGFSSLFSPSIAGAPSDIGEPCSDSLLCGPPSGEIISSCGGAAAEELPSVAPGCGEDAADVADGELGSSFFFSRAWVAEMALRPPPKVSRGFFCGAKPGVPVGVAPGETPPAAGAPSLSPAPSAPAAAPASRSRFPSADPASCGNKDTETALPL